MQANKSVNVIFYHPRFSNGGVERTNIGLAQCVIDAGHTVTFITYEHTEHFLKEAVNRGINFISLDAKRAISAQVALTKVLRKLSLSFSRVIVISCQHYANISCCLFRLTWPRNCELILSERNHISELTSNPTLKNQLIKNLMPLSYRLADIVIANSTELADSLSGWLKIQVKVIYNPTVNDRLFRLSKEEISEIWFHNLDRPIFIGIGRLSIQKDFSTLIKAFDIYKKNGGSGTLLILGEGEEKEELGKLISSLGLSNAVEMPGFINNPYKFLKNSDVFVLSSIYEGLPNALIEALALDITTISTQCKSGPNEILLQGRAGFLTPLRDPKAIASEMKTAVTNSGLTDQMKNAAKAGLIRFTPESITGEFLTLLNLPCNPKEGAKIS